MTDLTERLLTRLRELNTTDDHARGCQGREYHCSCDYDIRVENAVFEAITALETLTQENARLREAGWRDIESAPKDGTQFLALVSNGWYAIARAPAEALQKGWPYQWWLTSDRQSYPVVETHSEDSSFGMTLEYWMPLPPAPARKALGGGDEKE